MSNIHILPPHEAQKIAAGEVVERPANIVKELLENSIDAGASHITVLIEKAGKTVIKLTDNGSGMSPEDARLCFERHATSKITRVEELDTVTSFGFRGEALASIAAISKITLITKQTSDDSSSLGTCLTYYDGTLHTEKAVACPVGTTIEIRDLFYNVPARKKFLKQDDTEWNQIQTVLYALCMAHLSLSCKVYHNGKLVLHAPSATTLTNRLTQLWGHNVSTNLTPLIQHDAQSTYTFSGCISQPQFWRYGRTHLFFFVNNRLVKNQDLGKAVLKGYRNVLPPGRFPAACIFLTTHGTKVDVNIHPRKEEVRFTHPGRVSTQLAACITATLEAYVTTQLTPAQAPFVPTTPEQPLPLQGEVSLASLPPELYQQPRQKLAEHSSSQSPTPLHEAMAPSPTIPTPIATAPEPKDIPTKQHTFVTQQTPRFIGQLFATYLIIQQDEQCVIIDQHAAHERILYHQFAHTFSDKAGTRLLFPEVISLSPSSLSHLLTQKQFFASQGIELEQAGPEQIAIISTPPKIQKESLKEFVYEMCSFIEEHQTLDTETFSKKLNEHMHSHMACKAAVKAGDILDDVQAKAIIEQLLQTPNRFICVHGRPTMWPIRREDLEKKFRRR